MSSDPTPPPSDSRVLLSDQRAGMVVQQPKPSGIALIILAAVLWSLSGLFTQLSPLQVWDQDTRGIAIAFWRAIFALVLLLPLVRRWSWNWRMIPMTFWFATMNISFLTAMVVGSPANTIWMQYLAPCWVMLGAMWVFGDRSSRKDWVMLGFCTLGVLLILVMETVFTKPAPQMRWWAPLLALYSGVSYAGVILCIRSMPQEDPAWLISLNHLVTALAVFPLVAWTGASVPSGWLWLILAGLGVFQMGLPYFLFAHGLKTTPSHIAALLTLLEPIILPFWVHLVRHNDPAYSVPSWWTWLGGALILSGLAGRYIGALKRSRVT